MNERSIFLSTSVFLPSACFPDFLTFMVVFSLNFFSFCWNSPEASAELSSVSLWSSIAYLRHSYRLPVTWDWDKKCDDTVKLEINVVQWSKRILLPRVKAGSLFSSLPRGVVVESPFFAFPLCFIGVITEIYYNVSPLPKYPSVPLVR